MPLRIRLALVFLAVSVIPLSAVTFYSYVSNREAFRRAAEVKSDLMAEELGQRMEMATNDLGRRVSRLFRAAREETAQSSPQAPPGPRAESARGGAPGQATSPRAGGSSAAVAGAVPRSEPPRMPAPLSADVIARELGGFASVLDGIEWWPALDAAARPGPASASDGPARGADPARPTGLPPDSLQPRPRGPISPRPRPSSRTPEAPQVPPADARRNVVVLAAPGQNGSADAARRAEQLRAEMLGTARQMAVREAAAVRDAALTAAGGGLSGRDMELPVMEGSRRVGSVHARLNLERMLLGVLSLTRRDQGEIPFAIDQQGRVHTEVASDGPRLAALPLVASARERTPGAASDGGWVVVTRTLPSGVLFGIARPIGESLAEMRRAAARGLGLGLGFIVMALFGVLPLATRVTRNLTRLTEGVDRIAKGDLAARVEVASSDEVGTLAAAVNRMAADLAAHERLVVEQERMRRELELSRQIQTEMLPREALRVGIAEVKGVSIPAREVGGDFFNYFALPGGQLALLVGDVSGKGISAALLMANIQATLRARLPVERELGALASTIDVEVAANTPAEVYLTLFLGILDQATGVLRWVNAGHNPQFVVRAGGAVEHLSSSGIPIGLLPGHGYVEGSAALADGDLLFFYTDGTVEIGNEAGEFFGPERLAASIVRERDAGVDALLARVEAELRAFRGGAEPFDDATMMALRIGKRIIE